MQFDNLYGEWKDGDADLSVIERWMQSESWNNICEHAEDGDADSIQMMEQVHLMLSSVIFHMKLDNNHEKVCYELGLFEQLLNDFES